MTNLNISANEYILKIKYKIIDKSGISQLNFENVLISDINGIILEPTEHKNCKITINEPVIPESVGKSSVGGRGSSSSSASSGQSTSATGGGTNTMDSYSALLEKGPEETKTEEGVFFTQTSNEKEEAEIKQKDETEEKGKKTVPIIIVALTAALGIAAVAIFELRK